MKDIIYNILVGLCIGAIFIICFAMTFITPIDAAEVLSVTCNHPVISYRGSPNGWEDWDERCQKIKTCGSAKEILEKMPCEKVPCSHPVSISVEKFCYMECECYKLIDCGNGYTKKEYIKCPDKGWK